jgi:hypothetical protein
MTARYPGQQPQFTSQIDGQDGVNAQDVNTLYEEVAAIAAELGVDPAGTAATVDARISTIESGLTAFVSTAGGSVVNPASAATKGIAVRAHASQTANIFEVTNTAGNSVYFAVGSSGALTIPSIDGGTP